MSNLVALDMTVDCFTSEVDGELNSTVEEDSIRYWVSKNGIVA